MRSIQVGREIIPGGRSVRFVVCRWLTLLGAFVDDGRGGNDMREIYASRNPPHTFLKSIVQPHFVLLSVRRSFT